MARTKRHPGSIARSGPSYRVTLCVGGKVHRFTVPTDDRRIAEHHARKRYAELTRAHTREQEGLPDVVRFSALVAEFRTTHMTRKAQGTREAYEDSLKPICTYFIEQQGDPAVDKVRRAHVAAFLDWRQTRRLHDQRRKEQDKRPVSARTVAKDRAVLHKLFRFAEQREYREGNPVMFTEQPKGDAFEPVILDSDQYEALLRECQNTRRGNRLHLYALVLGEVGLREQEALHLHWSDLDLRGGFLTVASGRDGRRTKSGRSRQVPMTARLRAAFGEYRDANRLSAASPYVFEHNSTRRHRKQGERIRCLRSAFKAAAKRAKLPARLRQHDLRHRRVTTWLAEGKSPALVQQAMGHSTITTTMKYYQFLPEHLRSLVDNEPQVRAA